MYFVGGLRCSGILTAIVLQFVVAPSTGARAGFKNPVGANTVCELISPDQLPVLSIHHRHGQPEYCKKQKTKVSHELVGLVKTIGQMQCTRHLREIVWWGEYFRGIYPSEWSFEFTQQPVAYPRRCIIFLITCFR